MKQKTEFQGGQAIRILFEVSEITFHNIEERLRFFKTQIQLMK